VSAGGTAADSGHVRPRIVASRCLNVEAVRYNAQVIRDPFMEVLAEHADVRTVCPEVEIGLGVPRDPIRLVASGDGTRLVQPATGRDVTDEMDRFSAEFLASLAGIDGFVLKNRSPSCGIGEVKVYAAAGNAPPTGKGAGRFGGAVLERFPHAAVEDEGRLRDHVIRDRFLTRVWTLARFRAARDDGRFSRLVDFHSRHKYLLLTVNPEAMRRLGRLVASLPSMRPELAYEQYGFVLGEALGREISPRAHADALLHGLGHVSRELAPREKQHFLGLVAEFREGRIPLSAPREVLRAWAMRFDQRYLALQWYFDPYPRELLMLRDSKGIANVVA